MKYYSFGQFARYNGAVQATDYGFSRASVMPTRVWAVVRVGYASDPTVDKKRYLPDKMLARY
jgi:hypothetical protein